MIAIGTPVSKHVAVGTYHGLRIMIYILSYLIKFLCWLTLSLLMSYIYGAPSKARNLTSYIYIYMDEIFYWGFCFLNGEFR
jgi:hypothetical protein